MSAPAADDRPYAALAQQPFASLQALASQLAGFLLLHIIDPKASLALHGALDALRSGIDEAEEQLRGLSPHRATARHHHHHLLAASDALRQAHAAGVDRLLLLRFCGQTDGCEWLVRRAIDQLRHASNALDGFALVDLAECCGSHANRPVESGAPQLASSWASA